jgi:hypothetical protein
MAHRRARASCPAAVYRSTVRCQAPIFTKALMNPAELKYRPRFVGVDTQRRCSAEGACALAATLYLRVVSNRIHSWSSNMPMYGQYRSRYSSPDASYITRRSCSRSRLVQRRTDSLRLLHASAGCSYLTAPMSGCSNHVGGGTNGVCRVLQCRLTSCSLHVDTDDIRRSRQLDSYSFFNVIAT